ncbi:uroporphyrinogen-III C-methyltransferase [Litorimonas taeanensis]|uniref:Uroporphyrinogen-III C-methyltransferase n=1 Tax=Litorimonas taeanensis TaxID=568099 RepID=A0A420WK42_9PROT|nr:siroheme synthase CysG [Litorimonas taeanensis]RKQ71393.1 uroporphyrinogen-III C-methyltransferase [Litorimonas taeanensis]
MRYLPIHVDTKDTVIRVIGGGKAAEAKLRTLVKTEARLEVISSLISPEIKRWHNDNRVIWIEREFTASDINGAKLIYAATDDVSVNSEIAKLCSTQGVLVNAADQKDACAFITPALVDRSPVVISIGTEGTSPGLGRALKADLEKRLPSTLGALAKVTQELRKKVKRILPNLSDRQSFWANVFQGNALESQIRLDTVTFAKRVEHALEASPLEKIGHVVLVGAGPGNPDLMTIAGQQALHCADVVIYDRLVSEAVLELGRREAEYIYVGKTPHGPSVSQEAINDLIVHHAKQGKHVVRLKSGDPLIFGRADEEIQALRASDIPFKIVPGITAAAGAAAEITASLTSRGKNSAITFLTGHDMKGFAEQDWRALSQKGARAVVYMGVGASRFIQGRLHLHGAAADMPVTVVENATRSNQVIISSSLSQFVDDMASASINGPAVLMIGYEAHDALATPATLKEAS